jgi:hypothetical protein
VEIEIMTSANKWMKRFRSISAAGLLSGLLVAGTGCEKDDPAAEDDWVIEVSAEPASFQIVDPESPESSTITAVVFDDAGRTQQGIGVRFTTDAGSMRSGGRVIKTDSRGEAQDELTVVDSSRVTVRSGSAEGDVQVAVGAQNEPPTANISITPRTSSRIGTAVQFSGSQSEDPDGQVVRYRWTISYNTPGRIPAESSRPSFCVTQPDGSTEVCDTDQTAFTRTYTEPAHLEISLVVTDDLGKKSVPQASAYDIVGNLGPTADLGPSPQVGSVTPSGTYFCTITLSACGSTDADAPQGGRIMTYEFSWGDGSEVTNTCLRQHSYRAPGDYIVHLTVYDNGIGDGDGDGDNSASDFDDPCNQTPPDFSCPEIKTDETEGLDSGSSQPKDVKVTCAARP